jgi:tetratricopeptide (TPR) repeat protein
MVCAVFANFLNTNLVVGRYATLVAVMALLGYTQCQPALAWFGLGKASQSNPPSASKLVLTTPKAKQAEPRARKINGMTVKLDKPLKRHGNNDVIVTPAIADPAKATSGVSATDAKPVVGNSLNQGLEAYNRGVDLFGQAQQQAERGNVAGQKSLIEAAVDQFKLAIKVQPDFVEALSNIGFAQLTLKQYPKAIQSFNVALAKNPNHLNTLNGLATAYALSNRLPESITTFNKLTTLDPANAQYCFNKGSVLQRAGKLPEAQAAYQQALNIDANDQRSLFNMGTLYENMGKLPEAVTYYKLAKAVAIDTPMGLEALRRLEGLESRLQPTSKL